MSAKTMPAMSLKGMLVNAAASELTKRIGATKPKPTKVPKRSKS